VIEAMESVMLEHDKAAVLYVAGRTLRELAIELGSDAKTIRQWLVRAGIQRRRTGPRGRTDVPTDLLVRMREEDFTLAEIARFCSMSRTGVRRRLLRAAGVPRAAMNHSTPAV
jgi:DNA-directed RNA polymerase specialized sigma24 family protein